MKKRLITGMALWASLQCGIAQSLEKMQWFNEPEQWKIENQALTMYVTPQSDYWRISHYGFTVETPRSITQLTEANLRSR